MSYTLEGRLLEACTCNILCPCWVGEDPDNGTCDGVLSWRVDNGTVDGVDVSGLTITALVHIPGNILKGNWKAVMYIDDKASEAQQRALLDVWSGEQGGPVADLVKLVGEVVGVERAATSFEVEGGKGTLTVGQAIETTLAPFQGATGQATSLHDSVFTTIPGSPAYVGKASSYKVNVPNHGFSINLEGHNAVQGSFRFEG